MLVLRDRDKRRQWRWHQCHAAGQTPGRDSGALRYFTWITNNEKAHWKICCINSPTVDKIVTLHLSRSLRLLFLLLRKWSRKIQSILWHLQRRENSCLFYVKIITPIPVTANTAFLIMDNIILPSSVHQLFWGKKQTTILTSAELQIIISNIIAACIS